MTDKATNRRPDARELADRIDLLNARLDFALGRKPAADVSRAIQLAVAREALERTAHDWRRRASDMSASDGIPLVHCHEGVRRSIKRTFAAVAAFLGDESEATRLLSEVVGSGEATFLLTGKQ